LQVTIENLKARLNDEDMMRESLQFSIKEGHERASHFRDKVITESNELHQLMKKVDELNL